MNITKHARIRLQQRGMREQDADIILRYGKCIPRSGGAEEYLITKRIGSLLIQEEKQKSKQEIKQIEKCIGRAVMVHDNETVITALLQYKKITNK